MRYLGNAFSLGMLDFLDDFTGVLHVDVLSVELAHAWMLEDSWESCVGHQDTADMLSSMLGMAVPMRRVSLSLKPGDRILVAQYSGPRLPEGATSLPEGAQIRWILVRVFTAGNAMLDGFAKYVSTRR